MTHTPKEGIVSALPHESAEVAADTVTGNETDETASNVRNLYAIPRPDPVTDDADEGSAGVVSTLLKQFTPPDMWSQPTPSPAEEYNRAKHGAHLQVTGPLRHAAVAYAAITGALNVKDKVRIWIRSHPSRLLVAVLLMGLLIASPARPYVAWILFGVPHMAFEFLTG